MKMGGCVMYAQKEFDGEKNWEGRLWISLGGKGL